MKIEFKVWMKDLGIVRRIGNGHTERPKG